MSAIELKCRKSILANCSPSVTPVSSLQDDHPETLTIAVAWVLLFLTGVFAYLPGLNGPFVFDDFGSIDALGNLGGVRDWETFKAFVFGGNAGPTGRPLALLSFLIDANNWPADPWPFKRTNLLIHLANGAILGGLIHKILGILEFNKRNARWIALISTGCWLLHPFLVSTTLYAVQRMAQLSTLFTFLGLFSYLSYRSLITTKTMKAYAGMSVSAILFTFLAMISKENGILLPLLIGVVEMTVLASQRPRIIALNRYWSATFIVFPSLVIALYLLERLLTDRIFEVMPPRDFSVYERLLTQPRVLVDYLRHWFVPELYTAGVFQDHFVKSTGILSPITTVLSALLHVAIISLSIVKRRRWPLFALATLFFYASHVLESSVINLELYFEHRNYLSAAFLFVPLVVLLQKKINRPLFIAVTVSALLVLASFTRYSATVWQDYPSMVAASALKAPTSARAQSQHSLNLYNEKRYEESLDVIDRALQNIPNNASLLLIRGNILCDMGIFSAIDFNQSANILSSRPYDPRSIRLYTTLTSQVADGHCPEVSLDALRTMFSNMFLLPQNADPTSLNYSQIKYFVGYIDVRAGQPSIAVREFEESLQARPGAGHAMMMAAVLATSNYFVEALHFSDIALEQLDADPPGILQGTRVSENDVRVFRANIRVEMNAVEPGAENAHPVP